MEKIYITYLEMLTDYGYTIKNKPLLKLQNLESEL